MCFSNIATGGDEVGAQHGDRAASGSRSPLSRMSTRFRDTYVGLGLPASSTSVCEGPRGPGRIGPLGADRPPGRVVRGRAGSVPVLSGRLGG